MKKYIVFTVLFLTLMTSGIFTSCKDDEPKDLIVGTWTKDSDSSVYTFNEGGTCFGNGISGTWSIAGNSLTVTFSNQQPTTYQIVSISETRMVLRFLNEPTSSYTKQ